MNQYKGVISSWPGHTCIYTHAMSTKMEAILHDIFTEHGVKYVPKREQIEIMYHLKCTVLYSLTRAKVVVCRKTYYVTNAYRPTVPVTNTPKMSTLDAQVGVRQSYRTGTGNVNIHNYVMERNVILNAMLLYFKENTVKDSSSDPLSPIRNITCTMNHQFR